MEVEKMIYYALRGFCRLISMTPLSFSRVLGRSLAATARFLPGSREEIVTGNIKRGFPHQISDSGARRLSRKVYRHFGQMLFEIPYIMKLNLNNLDKFVQFVNEDYYLRALDKGKGAFLLTGHYGNWEWMCAAVSLKFGGLSVVARTFDLKPLDQFFTELRGRFGGEVIDKQKAMRRILQNIKEKRSIGILLDQNVDWYDGVFVRFLNQWACTNKGLALMALKTGTPVIPVFSMRTDDGRYRIIFEKEIDLVRTGDKTIDVEKNTALFTRAIEQYVQKRPDHWFWFHRRWKTRPTCPLPEYDRF
jgi:KDO2-lipid IV(A) lauroyltransferase